MDWAERKVLVTGGASFIGSHLVDSLVERGAFVRVVDDLSSGLLNHIEHHIAAENVQFIKADLRDQEACKVATEEIHTVFHLAADHGGRGYVDTFQAGPAGPGTAGPETTGAWAKPARTQGYTQGYTLENTLA